MNLYRPLHEIMSKKLYKVMSHDFVTKVAAIFEEHTIHHIVVVARFNKPVGIISRHDYHQYQHHFTRMGSQKSEEYNKRLFQSMTAQEIMTQGPVTLDKDDPIYKAIELFMPNLIHSVIITDESGAIGIVTTHDILKEITIESSLKI